MSQEVGKKLETLSRLHDRGTYRGGPEEEFLWKIQENTKGKHWPILRCEIVSCNDDLNQTG